MKLLAALDSAYRDVHDAYNEWASEHLHISFIESLLSGPAGDYVSLWLVDSSNGVIKQAFGSVIDKGRIKEGVTTFGEVLSGFESRYTVDLGSVRHIFSDCVRTGQEKVVTFSLSNARFKSTYSILHNGMTVAIATLRSSKVRQADPFEVIASRLDDLVKAYEPFDQLCPVIEKDLRGNSLYATVSMDDGSVLKSIGSVGFEIANVLDLDSISDGEARRCLEAAKTGHDYAATLLLDGSKFSMTILRNSASVGILAITQAKE